MRGRLPRRFRPRFLLCRMDFIGHWPADLNTPSHRIGFYFDYVWFYCTLNTIELLSNFWIIFYLINTTEESLWIGHGVRRSTNGLRFALKSTASFLFLTWNSLCL
jgi:hypothetical protein